MTTLEASTWNITRSGSWTAEASTSHPARRSPPCSNSSIITAVSLERSSPTQSVIHLKSTIHWEKPLLCPPQSTLTDCVMYWRTFVPYWSLRLRVYPGMHGRSQESPYGWRSRWGRAASERSGWVGYTDRHYLSIFSALVSSATTTVADFLYCTVALKKKQPSFKIKPLTALYEIKPLLAQLMKLYIIQNRKYINLTLQIFKFSLSLSIFIESWKIPQKEIFASNKILLCDSLGNRYKTIVTICLKKLKKREGNMPFTQARCVWQIVRQKISTRK